MKPTLRLLTALLLAPLGALHAADKPAQTTRPDIILADFEQGYGDWTVNGKAFDHPTTAVSGATGFVGKGLADSADQVYTLPAWPAAGTLTSPVFTSERNFIRFLVGGLSFSPQTGLQLLIDGKLEFFVCGNGDRALRPGAFDVSSFQGRKAQLVARDAGVWQAVAVDEILASDSAGQGSRVLHPMSQCVAVDKQMDLAGMRYLVVPINKLAPTVNCVLEVDGQPKVDLQMRLAVDAPVDFWASYPLDGMNAPRPTVGRTSRLRWTGQTGRCLAMDGSSHRDGLPCGPHELTLMPLDGNPRQSLCDHGDRHAPSAPGQRRLGRPDALSYSKVQTRCSFRPGRRRLLD